MDVSRQRYTRSVISVTADVRLSSCFRRVSTYIAEGRDDEIVDPDHGANVSAKVEKLQKMGWTSVHPNLARVPKCPGADDPGWTSNLCKLPFFTFRTLYRHFVERSEKEVDDGEYEREDESGLEVESMMEDSDVCVGQQPPPRKFRSFRGLDKGYRFFRDGHVQKIRLSPVLRSENDGDHVYVTCTVLPSMRKDRLYDVRVCCTVPANSSVSPHVRAAYCVCPAGLAGSCNHIAALLYALEDFVRLGLREEASKTCTEKLQAWNRPRARKVKPSRISEVFLKKEEYSKRETKRLRIKKPSFDPRPLRERLPIVEEVTDFVGDLSIAHEELLTLKPTLVSQYGSSSWLKLLEKTPPPSSASSSSSESGPESDTSSETSANEGGTEGCTLRRGGVLSPEDFFKKEVLLTREDAIKLEETTRTQGASRAWHTARKLRVTSTMAKAVACRRKQDFTALIRSKLEPQQYRGSAMKYGCKNEANARSSYVQAMQREHPGLKTQEVGLMVDPSQSWLGASPDGLVHDPCGCPKDGLLEIKCPYVGRNGMNAQEYAAHKSSCLTPSLQLKQSHAYFYQVQVAMAVSQWHWCDFVVWAPQFVVVIRVRRDDAFLSGVLPKLEQFYFAHLLPALSAEAVVIVA